MESTGGGLFTVKEAPEEQTMGWPEIERLAPGCPYKYLIPAISSEPKKRCEPLYTANINEPDTVVWSNPSACYHQNACHQPDHQKHLEEGHPMYGLRYLLPHQMGHHLHD